MIDGPKKPPRFPSALMNAIPPAAAVPESVVVTSAQNGAITLQMPDAVRQIARRLSVGVVALDARKSPSEPVADTAATCRRRSRVRSEWRATSTITTTAHVYGSAVSIVVPSVPRPEKFWTILGSQNVRP